MNTLVVLSCLMAYAVAAPQFGGRPQSAPAAPGAAPKEILIVKQAQDGPYHDGSFNYNFETENGISSQANGQLKDVGTENEALVIQGSYSYVGADGVPVVITYIADENGFQPQGDVLPTPPPVPEAIQRALDYLRSLPPSKDDQKRK